MRKNKRGKRGQGRQKKRRLRKKIEDRKLKLQNTFINKQADNISLTIY